MEEYSSGELRRALERKFEMEMENNIPINNRNKTEETFQFEKMEIGQSFLVEARHLNKLRVYASVYKNNHPEWNYTTRKQPGGAVRIWRIAADKKPLVVVPVPSWQK